MIRTTNHYFLFPNRNKKDKLTEVIRQYHEATQYFVDFIWENLIDADLNSPSMIKTKEHKVNDLSQRMLKCSATQACGIVKATLEQKRKRLHVLSKLEVNSPEYISLK